MGIMIYEAYKSPKSPERGVGSSNVLEIGLFYK